MRDTQESFVRVEIGLPAALGKRPENPVWLVVTELARTAVVQREPDCCSVNGGRADDQPSARWSMSEEVHDPPVVRLVAGEVEAAADPRGNHCLDP